MGTLVGVNPVLGMDNVVVSLKPLHSLVSNVMHGAGQPHLLVHGAASPHIFSLKPSSAKLLRKAKVIFWIGEILEAALIKPIKTLGIQANLVTLSKLDGLKLLKARNSGLLDNQSHENHNHAHSHSEIDGHLWLDPDNARIFLDVISSTLARLDVVHADTYRANAAQAKKAIAALTHELDAALQPIRGRPFIVFHDAYQYFEHRFNVDASGSVALGDASSPGPARIAAIRQKVQTLGAHCVFSEPQFRSKIITTVIEGTTARSATLDPLGATLKPGPELYSQLLRNLGDNLLTCLR